MQSAELQMLRGESASWLWHLPLSHTSLISGSLQIRIQIIAVYKSMISSKQIECLCSTDPFMPQTMAGLNKTLKASS